MLLYNTIQLGGYFFEWTVQIQSADTDLVAAHMVNMIRLYGLIRLCVQQHTRYGVWLIPILGIFVFDIGEDLVEARGIEPLSESNLTRTSPGAVCYLHSLIPAGTNTLRDLVAS